jgi:taurine dioxygenase
VKVEKLTCHIGAELSGVSLAEAARNDDLFGAIRAELLTNKALFLRDQEISKADHVAFASRFGTLEDHPVVGSDPENPGLVQIYKDENSPPDHFENAWHCDATWRDAPPMGAVLRCIACPPVGGDTMWANMAKAYADLPDHIKATIDDLKARHSIEATFGARMAEDKRHALKAQFPDAEHPVVRTHPETGEKVLFVSGFATHFTNFHTAENVRYGQDYAPGGAQLLAYLIGRSAIPEYQVRWRWQPNSVAIWDNRCTQHYAVMDYSPCVRQMDRASISGDKVF